MELKLAAMIGAAILLTAGALALVQPHERTAAAVSGGALPPAERGRDQIHTTEGKSMDGMSKETREAAQAKLTPDQYKVCVMGGTEMPFNNKYYDHHEDGTYHCVVCGAELFGSDTKYDSGSGWPSFFRAIDEGRIREVEDTSLGMIRTEVRCASCDAHLGHLFDDGPAPTGMRYCINSASLDFSAAEE